MRASRIVAILTVCFTALAGAEQIFYDSFEGPGVGGLTSATDPSGWSDTSPVGNRAGLGYLTGSSYVNFAGDQAAWLNVYNGQPQLETTTAILNTNLVAESRYALTFNAASDGGGYTLYADLLAGSDVVLTATVSPGSSRDFAENVASSAFIPKSGDPGVGQALRIRLRVTGGHWSEDSYVDNLRLEAVPSSTDTTPPTPDPMTWVQTPTPCGRNGVVMTCSTATDLHWVEYCFTNTVNGNTSGWINQTTWRDIDLSHGATYSYRAKARDRSVNWNETQWSTEESAQVDRTILFYESFEGPVVAGATSTTDPTDWLDTSSGNRAGLGHLAGTSYANVTGAQAAWLNVYNTVPRLETTPLNFSAFLRAHKEPYTLTFNAASDAGSYFGYYTAYADLMAGDTVVMTAQVTPNSRNFAPYVAETTHLPDAGDPGIGELLRIRLRASGGAWNNQLYVDNLKLTGPSSAGLPGTVLIVW